MKRFSLIIALLLGAVSSWGQDLSKDFVIIDNSCPNAEQLKTRYNSGPDVFIVLPTDIPAPAQIAAALSGKQVADLHLFVSTKPGTCGFGNFALNPESTADQSGALKQWATHVKGKVIIHSSEVFISPRGMELKSKLEQVTGLSFVAQ